jgi:16S rRNA (adenine1518-N6/adenine1519-N6)-dimethyltransferase
MSGDGLPPLRDVIRGHGLSARKSLGQNFLLDLNLTRKVARAAGDLTDSTVLEIGPGPGGLTRALLMEGAREVIAIEKDERCIAAILEISEAYPDRVTVLNADALTFDYETYFSRHRPVKIVANLPYNIATQLLVDWLTVDVWPPFYQSMTLMFQREVAERIVAAPGETGYGRLGVLTGWRCNAKIVFDLPARAFIPPPKVTSSIVHIVPRADAAQMDAKLLGHLTQLAFGQRRKMLRQSLKSIGGEALLVESGIDPTRRAETLSVDEFLGLANLLKARNPKKGQTSI